ncbi:hypothetical protein PO878_07935 [Iamia majanohamensis]|uniref:Lipoprotein n=1 Tax=Iamia majanohamensis TaxID=467976 RepID=A0AAE9YHL9_9ACTN|nr:hypothetical protein [Iamia majanohamensis]WCO68657.1 hypothetical protein PO878_07935 [Iamia majanohamensis]
MEPRTHPRPVVWGALVLLLVGAVAACGGDDGPDASPAALARTLEQDYDLSSEQADCVAGRVFDSLSDDEVAALRDRDEDDALPADVERRLRAALVPCASVG